MDEKPKTNFENFWSSWKGAVLEVSATFVGCAAVATFFPTRNGWVIAVMVGIVLPLVRRYQKR